MTRAEATRALGGGRARLLRGLRLVSLVGRRRARIGVCDMVDPAKPTALLAALGSDDVERRLTDGADAGRLDRGVRRGQRRPCRLTGRPVGPEGGGLDGDLEPRWRLGVTIWEGEVPWPAAECSFLVTEANPAEAHGWLKAADFYLGEIGAGQAHRPREVLD